MQQDFSDSNDLSYLSSKNKQQLQFPSLGIANKELEQIRFQCNLKLLQQKIIMLFGFPSIQVDSERIYKYLKGIQYQSQFEQLKKIRTLISFIGEVTYITNWNERVHIINQRIQQFFSIKGLEIKWNEQQWKKEIDSIFILRINNPYYDTIPNKQFSYVNLFNIIGIKLPTELQQVQHHSFNSIQTSNMTDDFNLLCDIEEFTIMRNIRIFIQKFNHKFNGFMDLLLKIETNKNLEEHNIKYCYQTLCQELEHIFTSFNLKHQHSTDNKKYPLPLNTITQDKNEQLIFRIPKPTASLTTIISGSIQSNSKKQKKKIKLQQHLHYGSYILEQDYSFEQDKINQNDNESNIIYYDNGNDLISQMQNQLINNVSFQYSTNSENSLEKIKQKILTYEYMQYKLEQVGYPCICLKESKLIQILQDQQLNYQDKKMLIVKLFNIITESFISKSGFQDVNKQLNELIFKFLKEIPIDYPIQQLNQILDEQCIIKSIMSIYGNLQNKMFSNEILSQIINRKFPDKIYQIKCLSTNMIFQQRNIQQLLDIFNIQELQNIRVLRQYIYEIYTGLSALINFKQLFQVDFDDNVLQEFILMEKQFINVLNQPLNFYLDSNYFQNQNQKKFEKLGGFDEQFNEKWKDQSQQKQDYERLKELPLIRNKEIEQIYEQNLNQQNQDVFRMLNLDQQQFNLECSPIQYDSTRFNFINNSLQQSQDLQQSTNTEFCSLFCSK